MPSVLICQHLPVLAGNLCLICRCVQEPARTIRGVHYHQARADSIDFEKKIIHCTDVYLHADRQVALEQGRRHD